MPAEPGFHLQLWRAFAGGEVLFFLGLSFPRNFHCSGESDLSEIIVPAQRQAAPEAGGNKLEQIILISCAEVRRELSNYVENDVTPELRARIEQHVPSCSGCKAVYDGMRNVLKLVSTTEIIELPRGFSRRLYRRLMSAPPIN